MRRSCNTSTTRQGAHDSALGSWAFVGLLHGAGTVEGYPNSSLHSLRHSHASILLSNGTPLAVVSERLGHANQDITLRLYSHCLPADRKAASQVWHTALAEVISEDRFRKRDRSCTP